MPSASTGQSRADDSHHPFEGESKSEGSVATSPYHPRKITSVARFSHFPETDGVLDRGRMTHQVVLCGFQVWIALLAWSWANSAGVGRAERRSRSQAFLKESHLHLQEVLADDLLWGHVGDP